MSPEMKELISENIHLVVVSVFAFLLIFKSPLGAVIEKLFPGIIRWFVKKKLDIELKAPGINPAEIVQSETIKTVDNPRFTGFASEQKIRALLIEPLGCMTHDAKLYCDWILYEVARAKREGLKLTFNMIIVERVDRRAKEAWLEAVTMIIKNNGVFVQIVFPKEPKNGLDELYQNLRECIKGSGAHCVLVRKEGREGRDNG